MSMLADFLANNTLSTLPVTTPVIEAVSTGDLAVFFDKQGMGKWKRPPHLSNATEARAPYYTTETSGAIRGSITVVNSAASSNVMTAALAGGGYAKVWSETGAGIVAAVFDADGNQVVANFVVDANGTAQPSIAAHNDGGFIIAWTNATPLVAWNRYDAGANSVASGTVAAANQLPVVICCANGDFVVGGAKTANTKILCYDRLNSANVSQQAGVTSITLPSFSLASTTGCAIVGGGFALGCVEISTGSAYFQRHDAAGATVGGAVNFATVTSGGGACLAGVANGGLVAAWAPASQNPKYSLYDAAGTRTVNSKNVGSGTGGTLIGATGLIDGGFAITYPNSNQTVRFKADGKKNGPTIAFGGTSISCLADGGIVVVGTNGSNYAQFSRYAATAATVVGSFSSTQATPGQTATAATYGTQTLTQPLTPSNIKHTGGPNPGNAAAVFGTTLQLRGLA